MLEKFKDTVEDFSESVKSAVAEKELDEDTLDPLLEEMRLRLLKNNVALETAEEIETELRSELLGTDVRRGSTNETVQQKVREVLQNILDDGFDLEKELEEAEDPPVIFLVGFNGSGKTTTAAKVAKRLKDNGKEVVLGAGDTFRAASIEQLEEHGEALDVDVISHEYESDPAAVGYDTVEHAEKEGKVAIVDTAGRSHADQNLMEELRKMVEVNEPDITLLVIDALSGNDTVQQAEAYQGMFDGIVATKIDVDESGGAVISTAHSSGKPVAFLGTGQGYEDLEEFETDSFIDRIVGDR